MSRTAATLLLGLGVLVAGCTAEPSAVGGPAVAASASARPGPQAATPVHEVSPTARSKPQYLTRSYQAPVASGAERKARRRAGTLRIPSLKVAAAVDAVGLDRGVMAIPDSPARIGWLRTTAAAGDTIGASVLSGHVSDRRDRPGALSRLRTVRRGAVLIWTDARGLRHRFVVTKIRRYPRSRGVPGKLFGVTGAHVLHLVTCTDRVRKRAGGFHYTANLVVTAKAIR